MSVCCRPDEVKDSSKSTENESQGGKTARPSNSMAQRHKRMPASKHSVDSSTSAGGIHEEWETASESSDILKDSDSQQQAQSAWGDKHAGSRRESKRGFSNQRHAQSRRGHYRDRPSADGGSDASQHQTGSVVSAAAVNSARHNTVPPSDPNGSTGNIHPVYRVDQVIFDDPVAIQTAFSDAFIRCVADILKICVSCDK